MTVQEIYGTTEYLLIRHNDSAKIKYIVTLWICFYTIMNIAGLARHMVQEVVDMA